MQTVRNRVLLAKEESVYGSDSAPTVADNALEIKNVKLNWQADVLERDNVRSCISPTSPVVGRRWVEVTFEMELKGSGTRGTAGRIGDLIEACSYAETIGDTGGSSSVTYKPCSTGQKSITLYIYDNDTTGSSVLHKITGAMGNFNIKLTAGQYGLLSFTLKGNYNSPDDVALVSTPTYETTIPPIVESCAFELNNSDDLIVQELTLDSGNDIVARDDINSPNGILGYIIPNRKGKGSFNPEATLIGTYDFWTDWVGSAQRALTATLGTSNGNKVTITAPKVTLDSIADGDRERILTRDIPFSLGQDTGDDELVLVFE
jgi:hypothetical protein